jgi:hypothetical protein
MADAHQTVTRRDLTRCGCNPHGGPALRIVNNLDILWAQTGEFLPALNRRFLGTPQPAEGQPGVALSKTMRYFRRGKILDVESI